MGGDNNENQWYNARHRGIYTYGLSPFYQKAVKAGLGHDVQVLVRFAREKVMLVPFVAFGLGVVYFANAQYHHNTRKRPEDYAHDE